MKARHLVTSLLLLFVGIAVAVSIARGLRSTPDGDVPATSSTDSPAAPTSTVIVETAPATPATSPVTTLPVATPQPAPVRPTPSAPAPVVASVVAPPIADSPAPPTPAARAVPAAAPAAATGPGPLPPAPPAAEHRVIRVAYFHATARCVTCRMIEQQAHDAVEGHFAGELAAGEVVWTTVNVDEPENRHFIQDYRLYTKSVIVSELVDGREARWKNLDQVWQLVRNQEAFSRYVVSEVRAFRGES